MALQESTRSMLDGIASRSRELLADLAAQVALRTGPGGEGFPATLAFFRARFEAMGATWEQLPGTSPPHWMQEKGTHPLDPAQRGVCVARSKCATGTPSAKVLLCGHIDTVHDAGSSFDRLTIAPDAKTATGPGCADMKGGLLVALAALEAAHRAGLELEWTFVLVQDEETGTLFGDSALRGIAQQCERDQYHCGLVFEPALPGGGLVVERPGSGQFMIECEGRAAHVGRDFAKGVSAVSALARAILAADELADPDAGLIVSVGPLEGGRATNIVPDAARAWGNVRCFSREAQERGTKGLLAIQSAANAIPKTRIQFHFNRPAKPTTPGVLRLASLVQECQGVLCDAGWASTREVPLAKTGGVCDGNNIQDATGHRLPVVDTLGVRGGGLHTTQEWIELASLVERAQLAALVLEALSRGAMIPSSLHAAEDGRTQA